MTIVAIAPAGTDQVPVEEFRSAVDAATAVIDFVNEYDPPRDPADYIGHDIGAEIVPKAPAGGWYYDHSTSTLVGSLQEAKDFKHAAIDVRTEELIAAGFEFPTGSGLWFSLSSHAQRNLQGLDQVRDLPEVIYPVAWNTLDDSAVLSIPDSATAHGFFLTAFAVYRAHLDSGTALKDQVRAATTVAEVDAVVDAR